MAGIGAKKPRTLDPISVTIRGTIRVWIEKDRGRYKIMYAFSTGKIYRYKTEGTKKKAQESMMRLAGFIRGESIGY